MRTHTHTLTIVLQTVSVYNLETCIWHW